MSRIQKLKASDLEIGDGVEIYDKKNRKLDIGKVMDIKAGVVWLYTIAGDGPAQVGYDLMDHTGYYAILTEADVQELPENKFRTEREQRRLERSQKRADAREKRKNREPKEYVPSVVPVIDFDKMQVTLKTTRNFVSGTYEFLWPKEMGKSRKEATDQLRKLDPGNGFKLFVASWEKGKTHLVVKVPEENCR